MSDPTDPHPSDLPPPSATPPTEPMPVTPGAAGAAAGGAAVPPGAPGAPGAVPTGEADEVHELDDKRPWYRTPAGIVAIIVGLAALLGLGAWLIWGGDDDPEPGVATLELTALDPSGATLDRGFTATVVGPADSPAAFEWILPTSGIGEERGGTTGSDGVIVFSWAPDDSVDNPNEWASRIVVTELVPAGFTPPGPTVPCVLQRIDEQDTTVTMTASVDPPDTTVDQLVAYTFENHEFLPGDRVSCELVSTPPPPTTTTVPETTTTAPETTTTVPETTTTAPETTTTVAETTTTVAETTTTVAETTTTVAPLPATAYEALEQAGGFTVFLSLVDQVPSVESLLRGGGPVTVLAPTDDALNGVTPPADPGELEQLLLSHVVNGEALDSTLIFDGRTEITVATGGTQPVDSNTTTIAGVGVVADAVDLAAENGVAHGLAGVLPIAAP